MKRSPAFFEYEYCKDHLIEDLQAVLKQEFGVSIKLSVLHWDDGDFTFYLLDDGESLDEVILDKFLDKYAETSGSELTLGLLESLFGIEDGFNKIKSYYEEGTYHISVKLEVVNERYKEAWAQANAIQETLDVILNEQEAWDNREVLKDRALAVCKLISDLVPEDMSNYVEVEDPKKLLKK